ncbi:spore protease YyaC [Alloiococcus sp. CFN-8]|uniref:spore protease YyaC n=1 Tax=Alloiococcus sp. CFN-8 TaxID=3416081 RepID=UPI003CEB1A7A
MKNIFNHLVKNYITLVQHRKSNLTKAASYNNIIEKRYPLTISSSLSSAAVDVYNALDTLIDRSIPLKDIIILCIGTDRATGDSLGPIVGYKLMELTDSTPLILGTLSSPVHGKNLHSTAEQINNLYPKRFIIAIDACLGSSNSIGNIYVERGPLYPGSALNKKLMPIGDISITAVVNSLSGDSFTTLQNTRLFTVVSIAEIIYNGILKFIVSRETYQNIE